MIMQKKFYMFFHLVNLWVKNLVSVMLGLTLAQLRCSTEGRVSEKSECCMVPRASMHAMKIGRYDKLHVYQVHTPLKFLNSCDGH